MDRETAEGLAALGERMKAARASIEWADGVEIVSAKEAEKACRFWRELAEGWERVAVGALWFTAIWIALSAYLAWELYNK